MNVYGHFCTSWPLCGYFERFCSRRIRISITCASVHVLLPIHNSIALVSRAFWSGQRKDNHTHNQANSILMQSSKATKQEGLLKAGTHTDVMNRERQRAEGNSLGASQWNIKHVMYRVIRHSIWLTSYLYFMA